MIDRLEKRTVAEFFAGIGLMRMGLEQTGWQVIFANDIDPQKVAMYQHHFTDPRTHFVCEDIHTLPTTSVPPVTLATASFPCVDLSLAGPLNGLHGRNLNGFPQGSGAFWGFVRILRELGEQQPPLVLLENVIGFLTAHKGSNLRLALQTLNDLGYIVDAFIVDAHWFVPQSRKRLFVVGIHETLLTGHQLAPIAYVSETVVRPKTLTHFIQANCHIRWSVRPLPNPIPNRLRLEDILDDLPDDSPEWWSLARSHKLLSQMSPRHKSIAEQMIAGDTWSYGTVFRRMREVAVQDAETATVSKVKRSMAELRTDGLAGCLRTPKGGSAKQILFKAGKGRYAVRLLTAREVAQLMGADTYIISSGRDQALFGFGDAVCVPVVNWIANHYLNPLINELVRCPSVFAGSGQPDLSGMRTSNGPCAQVPAGAPT